MKRKRIYSDYLDDIAHYAAKAMQFVGELNLEQFRADEEKSLAALYALQVIGGAASHLPESFKRRHPQVPWANVVGMRNLIVHGYYLVDVEIVWKTVRKDLPGLREAIDQIRAKQEGEEKTSASVVK